MDGLVYIEEISLMTQEDWDYLLDRVKRKKTMKYIKVSGMDSEEFNDMLNQWGRGSCVEVEVVNVNEPRDIDKPEWDGIHREWDLRHDITFLLGFIAGNSIEDDMGAYMFRLRVGLKSDYALHNVPDMAVKMSDVGQTKEHLDWIMKQ